MQTRKSWHEKTASLNLEKDTTKSWNLTKTLNEEAPSRSMTVLKVNDQLLTKRKAANEFAKFYKKESILMIPQAKVKNTKEAIKSQLKNCQPEPCMKEELNIRELEAAIRKLKTRKAPGPDGVSNDMLKHLGPTPKKTLLEMYNRC